MADALRAIRKREVAAADRLAADAQRGASGFVTNVLAHVAVLALDAVMDDDPARAVRRLRTNSALLNAIEKSARAAQLHASEVIAAAVVSGYHDDAQWRGDAVAAESGVKVAVTLTPADRARLRAYPIIGHTPQEVALYAVTQFRYGIDGALAVPLTGKVDVKSLPAALGEVGALHAARVANAVREAYFAGTSAAMRDLGAAFSQPMKAG